MLQIHRLNIWTQLTEVYYKILSSTASVLIAQLVARESENLEIVSSILTQAT